MATSAKMSFNFYQNGKFGTLPQNTTKDMEVTQDMHLKMSKKIAQLTKVIYALNTKNDEHEAVVVALKEQHEEEIQQLLAETKEKIDLYKNKICNEADQLKKIETLEACVAKYDQQKQTAFSEFDAFKKRAEERENSLKADHAEKMLVFSKEVLALKRNFEEQVQKFSDFRLNIESSQQHSTEQLRKQHELEIEKLKELYQSKSGDFETERLKLEEIHKLNVLRVEEQCDLLRTEKNKLIEDYEGKLSKAQAFYENELSVLKSTHSSSFQNEIERLKEEQDKLKKDWAVQESGYKQRIDRLIEQISTGEDELHSYKQQLENLQACVAGKEDGMSGLQKQVQAAKDEASRTLLQLKEQEAELVASKHMCTQQGQDLLNKSSLIGELEATRLQQESTINDLQGELSKLRDRQAWLENQQHTEAQSITSKLRSLEQSLEDISIEKQTMKEKYEREIKGLNEEVTEQKKTLTSQHSTEISQLKENHEAEMKRKQAEAGQILQDTTNTLTAKLNEETSKLTSEKNAVLSEFEQIKSDLLTKLKAAEEEMSRLQSAVKDSESGLGSASVHINNLKDASARLKQEVENGKAEIKQAKITISKLQAELEKLKLTSDAKLTAAEHELQTRTQQLTSDLETKWTETLKKETSELRHSLIKQKDDERHAALQQLSKLKDEELSSLKADKEREVTQLQKQIFDLQNKLDQSQSTASESLDQLRSELEEEKCHLETELQKVESEFRERSEKTDKEHAEQLNRLKAQQQQQLEELEARLKSEHYEEIQGQITAHKAALDFTRQEEEKKKVDELDQLRIKHKQQLDSLRMELSEIHQQQMEQQTAAHNSEIQAARIELERSIEITKLKERDHKAKTEELQSEVAQRERHMKNLDEEIHKLRRQLEYLSRDLDSKGQEISKIKADADINLQRQSEMLQSNQQAELNNLAADHLRETQEMLMEFNRAQELLKDKISELNILLDESEERYRNRDSRPEDLELIHHLRDAVSQREGRMKQLLDEKRYYQMELVNRETNFNKVFNSAPNVGVLNPLVKPKKKGDKSVGKFTSSPNLGSWGSANRLDPLPNSPLHDEKLNPSRPLPQPNFAKKFVK